MRMPRLWAGKSGGGNPGWPCPRVRPGYLRAPGRHEALIRFSNGSPHAGADAALGSVVMGMGLKLFGIEGQTLLEDEPDSHTFDYALINAPIFFCNTVEHYVFIQHLFLHAGEYFSRGKPGVHQFLHDWVTGMGTLEPEDWAWDELAAILSLRRVQSVNLLLSTYWTMAAGATASMWQRCAWLLQGGCREGGPAAISTQRLPLKSSVPRWSRATRAPLRV